MKRIGIIIMATILSILFGCGQNSKPERKDIFPTESFSVVKATINNKPVIGSFNMAYKNYSKKVEYSWCLTISLALDSANLFDNGLPKDKESARANKLENELYSEIKKLAIAHHIGHIFNDTFLDIYIYLDEPEKVHQYLQTQINKEGLAREFRYEINQDPNWATVKGFLK